MQLLLTILRLDTLVCVGISHFLCHGCNTQGSLNFCSSSECLKHYAQEIFCSANKLPGEREREREREIKGEVISLNVVQSHCFNNRVKRYFWNSRGISGMRK